MYRLDGALQSEVQLPAIGSVTGVGGEWDGSRIAIGFTSFAQPPTAYRVDACTGELVLLAEGQSIKDIARKLDLSVKTVDAHKYNLMRKLKIHDRAEHVLHKPLNLGEVLELADSYSATREGHD